MAEYNYSKQIKNTPTPNIFFPSKLMDTAYDGKRIYITIYESKTLSEIATVIKNGVKKELSQAKAIAGNPSVQSVAKIIKEIDYFKGTEKMTLALPLPNQFRDSQSHDFSIGTGMIRSVIDSSSTAKTFVDGLSKIAANSSAQKILANPGYFQNYTGSNPRDFSFNFKLIPNSKQEAKDIQSIIITLKKYSSPSLDGGAIMIAPHFFWFRFSNPILQDLTGIRPCIIKNIETNYAGSGILETTFDGMPKFIELNISISELRTLTEDKW